MRHASVVQQVVPLALGLATSEVLAARDDTMFPVAFLHCTIAE